MKHAAIVWLGLVLAACAEDPAATTIRMRAGAAPPAYGEVPFPTDAVRDLEHPGTLGPIAGLDALATRKLDLVTAHVAALDGFGVRPLVELFVDGELDEASLPAETSALDAPAVLVDVDPASPERGRVIATEWRYLPERAVIAGAPRPGVVLREGTRYAAFVTTALRDARGRPLAPSPALAELAAAGPRWEATAAALAELPPDVAGLAVFTTQHATAPLLAAREVLATLPPPTLTFADPALVFRGTAALDRVLGVATRATDGPRAGLERWGTANPTGLAHDHVGVLATGELSIARFRRDDTGTDLPDDETFGDGFVALDSIPITFVLPAAPPSPEGYPVVIHGHGLGSSRDALLAFAEPLTSRGFAVVGIDMAGHGSRYDRTDRVANLANQLPAFTGVTSQRDGFGDVTGASTQFDFFEGFQNVAAVRDSIRQSALDLSRVVQLVRRPDLDLSALGPAAKLDARRIAYTGESFGTVVGTLLAAIEPDVDLYVLDVPGGGILDVILPTSPEIAQLAIPIIETIYNPRARLDRWNQLLALMQAVIDGADPLTYAPHVLRDRFSIGGRVLSPRHVVAIEVLGDQVLSNQGTDALALALGLEALVPHLDVPAGLGSVAAPAAGNRDGQTAVLVQYAPATHGANWTSETGTLRFAPGFPADGPEPFPRLPQDVTIPNPIYETHEQVAEILVSHQRGEVPRVIVTKPPARDFDADGAPDDQDAAPLDPSRR